jgi:type III restriction enzyme
MPQVVIENPILNSPFAEPNRHFRFGEQGITDEIVAGRRKSSYFIPIPQARKKTHQIAFDTELTRDRIQENDFINKVCARVGLAARRLRRRDEHDVPPAAALAKPRTRA